MPSGSQTTSSPSMDTVPTDFIDGKSSEEDGGTSSSQSNIWGRLFPVGTSFTAIDLEKTEYSFGRGEMCDYQFNSPAMIKHPCFQAYSKMHFKLVRESTSTGCHIFLYDTSANGTFVNGEKVGKGNKQVLNNNDEIALALKKNKEKDAHWRDRIDKRHVMLALFSAFVFMDANANDDSDLPDELKQKYTIAKLLGRGACGEVKLAFEKGSCQKVAVKIIQKKKFTIGGKHQMNTSSEVMREVNILKGLKHPCIIEIHDVIDTPDTLFIILELVEGGELFDRVVSVGQLEENIAKILFYQMAEAIKYLHEQGISHRDLKPENILLSSESNETLVKVTDFGLSKFVDAHTMMKTFCGTPNYLAPEILSSGGVGAYTNAIDVWSLGVILYICLVGYPPFSEDRTDMKLEKQISGGHCTYPEEYWKDISKEAIDLVKKMLTVDPKKRITLTEALNHPWLKDEDAIKKAKKLMYPQSESMGPPLARPKKRKGDSSQEDALSPKRKN